MKVFDEKTWKELILVLWGDTRDVQIQMQSFDEKYKAITHYLNDRRRKSEDEKLISDLQFVFSQGELRVVLYMNFFYFQNYYCLQVKKNIHAYHNKYMYYTYMILTFKGAPRLIARFLAN
jgi:hypothetical protein